jgi:hypothetical protein
MIKNPSAAATPKQTFAIFVRTGYDVRACNLNMADASAILDGKIEASTFAGAIQKRKAAAPKVDFAAIHAEAHAAGMKAGTEVIPTPMVVVDGSRTYEPVMDGACGFAWVRFKGTTPWARWAKAQKLAGAAYPTGLSIWVHQFDQSITRKEAYATAYAQVLRNHGIEAYAGSRLD